MKSFFEFLVIVLNHYHINGLHLFWDSFEWFCLQINSDAKYFFLSCPRYYRIKYQGLIVVIGYHFQIWNKKEHNIIISWVIRSNMGPMYIETPYISTHMGPMYIKTPYVSTYMGPMYIETPYISTYMGPMYIETPYISTYMGPMYIKTPYISTHMGPMYIKTPYISTHMGPVYWDTLY